MDNYFVIADEFLRTEKIDLNTFLWERRVPLLMSIKTIRVLTGWDMTEAHQYIFQMSERQDELNREVRENASERNAWRKMIADGSESSFAKFDGLKFVFRAPGHIIEILPSDIDVEQYKKWRHPQTFL